MVYLYPAIIANKTDFEELNIDVEFKDGFIIDDDLSVQKKLEDNYGVPIVSIQESTRGNIIILYNPNGFVETNPLTKTRMAVIKGSLEQLKSEFAYMVSQRPDIKPSLLLDNYTPQTSPRDLLELKKWLKKEFD